MKIAIVTNLYPPFVRGGAEWLTHLVATELKNTGQEVVIITTAPNQALKKENIQKINEDGIIVYRFYPLNLYYYLEANHYPKALRLIWHIINLFNIEANRQIKKILVKEKPQVVITANLMGLTFLLPKLLRRLKLPHIHIVHDVQLLHPSGLFIVGNEYKSIWTKLYQLITRLLFGSPKVVIFPSQWLCQEYTSKNFFSLSNKIVQLNPSLVKPAYLTKRTTAGIKILYVGQAEEHKGIFWLLEILKFYCRSGWLMEIVVIGETGDKERVHKLIGNDPRFTVFDRLTQEEINRKYHETDIVVVPSLCLENSPVSIQHALAIAVPVLAVKVGGIPELIKEGETGWLFKAGNKDDLIKKLDYLLSNPEIIVQVADKIQKQYHPVSLSEYINKLIALLN
ncbi:MAG: glycosyltransferase [Patescibacteria group bacterium]